ncbi:zinc ribbon domain-containing protein [Nocardioides eburneiflavus]|uniref:Zinc ribbon domain-containing protein n=1 Tax=Nocardioides eburneiflavus TaxID=2518372 RepID=A0A4Z1C8K1_9ACTN|nr:zinc ribbon domain-containing protein [Nocardioides eburneiflavus]TGN66142.1 zinc ribbon domain-containing protein [Nocardioides eburneiflavus]
MDSCVSCGAELGVGRFCLNCGHPIGAPAPAPARPRLAPAPVPVEQQPIAPPVQAADPTPVAPTSPPEVPVEGSTQPPLHSPTQPTVRPPAARRAEPPAPAPARTRPEWDPRDELLPYEEVDEVDLPAVRGHAWLYWIAGAALLVALVLVLLEVLESDDTAVDATAAVDGTASTESSQEAGANEEAAAGQDEAQPPEGVGKRRELAGTVTFDVPGTAPPTQDFDGSLVAYEAGQMGDGDPSTAWRIAGDATGQKITMTLPETAVIHRLGIVNGYAKNVAGVAWYPNNRRILTATWQFADGSAIEQTFAERPGLQMMKVPPVATRTLSITINAVTPPGSGSLGRDYTAISEVSIIGQRAG